MTVPAMATDFPQISQGHGLRTFAGASLFYLTGMRTRGLSLLPAWSTTGGTTPKWELGGHCWMKIAEFSPTSFGVRCGASCRNNLLIASQFSDFGEI
jgi:hypothetical protein